MKTVVRSVVSLRVLIWFSLLTLASCGTYVGSGLTGVSQKGPFAIGSTVTVQVLDEQLNPTGSVYVGATSDNLGNFNLGQTISGRYVEVIVEGYFFNEISGALSPSTLTLRSISDLSEGPANINLLTSLQSQRLKVLVQSGKDFAAARTQARNELLASFKISATDVTEEFDKLNISLGGNGNAALLACSVIILGSSTVAQLSELLANLGIDLASNGTITNTNAAQLLANAQTIHLGEIRANLLARYAALGVTATIPSFETFVNQYVTISNGGVPLPQVSILASGITGQSIAVDSQSNVFLSDGNNNVIWKITPSGTKTSFASVTGTHLIAIDSSDNIYSAAWGGGALNKITPAGSVSTVGTIDNYPNGLTVDPNGDIYFTAGYSPSTHVVKKVTQAGVVSVFAGSGSAGSTNANGTSASFNNPLGLASDSSGNIYVIDSGNSLIRKISSSADVITFSGSGSQGTQNGAAATATFSFRSPDAQSNGIAISASDYLYVGQAYGVGLLRMVTPAGTASTYCGNGSDSSAAISGLCTQSPLYHSGLAVGPDGSVYFNDGHGNIAKISN